MNEQFKPLPFKTAEEVVAAFKAGARFSIRAANRLAARTDDWSAARGLLVVANPDDRSILWGAA